MIFLFKKSLNVMNVPLIRSAQFKAIRIQLVSDMLLVWKQQLRYMQERLDLFFPG